MAKIIEREPASGAPPGGWMVRYAVGRDDGQQVRVEVACAQVARAAAERAHNTAALEIMEDRAERLACELAENSELLDTESGLHPGLLIRIRFDPDKAGSEIHDVLVS